MQRRLTTIVAADLAGYSRLISADEEGTLTRLRNLFDRIILPGLSAGGGRLIKTMGDGLLAEFPSPVSAVRTMMDMLGQLAAHEADQPDEKRMRFRVGINLGDVVSDGDDILGDGVNIAARLESLAPPGGLCISRSVHDQVRGKIEAELTALGPQTVKNIPEPVEVWRVENTGSAPAAKAATTRPSIAVLPFDNMSTDPDQEFLADGIVEDVITELSRFRSLFVIARNSTFAYKGTHKDVRKIARELDVRYVVEGSVRRAGNRLRITAQLIEAETGIYVWADRFERTMEDLFDLQDEISAMIVSTVDVQVRQAEVSRSARRPPSSLDSWTNYQRGMNLFYQSTRTGNIEARKFLERALDDDPDFALACAGLALVCITDIAMGFSEEPEATLERGIRLARDALTLDEQDAMAHLALGRLLSMSGQPDLAIASLERAIELNPNLAFAHYNLGQVLNAMGRASEALPYVEAALRLNPQDPFVWMPLMLKTVCLIQMARPEDAIVAARMAVRANAKVHWTHFAQTVAYAAAGRADEAARAAQELIRVRPSYSITEFRAMLPSFNTGLLELMSDYLRQAGIPESPDQEPGAGET